MGRHPQLLNLRVLSPIKKMHLSIKQLGVVILLILITAGVSLLLLRANTTLADSGATLASCSSSDLDGHATGTIGAMNVTVLPTGQIKMTFTVGDHPPTTHIYAFNGSCVQDSVLGSGY